MEANNNKGACGSYGEIYTGVCDPLFFNDCMKAKKTDI